MLHCPSISDKSLEMMMTWRIPKVVSFGHTLRIVLFTNFQIPSSNFHSPSSATITYPTHPRKTLQLQSSHGVPRIGYNTDKEVQIWDSTTNWSSWCSLKSWSLLIGQVKLGNFFLKQKDLFCTVQMWAIVPQGCANTRAKGVLSLRFVMCALKHTRIHFIKHWKRWENGQYPMNMARRSNVK